jgi:hypothetical protein
MLSIDIRSNLMINKKLTQIQRQLRQQLPQDAVAEFVRLTPRRSGNARRNTTLQNGTRIVADYPYAQRLNAGWSRIQAPFGMTIPFNQWLKRRIKQIFGK